MKGMLKFWPWKSSFFKLFKEVQFPIKWTLSYFLINFINQNHINFQSSLVNERHIKKQIMARLRPSYNAQSPHKSCMCSSHTGLRLLWQQKKFFVSFFESQSLHRFLFSTLLSCRICWFLFSCKISRMLIIVFLVVLELAADLANVASPKQGPNFSEVRGDIVPHDQWLGSTAWSRIPENRCIGHPNFFSYRFLPNFEKLCDFNELQITFSKQKKIPTTWTFPIFKNE